MSAPAWTIGDRVRFIGDYEIPGSAESVAIPAVKAGTRGVVVNVKTDALWVEVPGLPDPVTVWFPEAFPDDFGKTNLLARE